ncbi:tetratricopeptide repeat protein [Gracilinema caldarium]|uniref:tetratricopeptide repeat protein n=1 Tax=Gracilinema caldarium TaxID=215591 RepID=UPI0026E961A4|nr:tetratricopeptide repeat protein [Gracilinema caldarium]
MKRNALSFFISLLLFPALLSAQQSLNTWFQKGQTAMVQEDWYSAAEAFLEALKINQSHAESVAALAECYYQLREYDQALSWVRKARTLNRGSMNLANLEALILIAMGQLETASSVLSEILAREPYNRDALFAAAELELARGKVGEAVKKYREAVARYPDDRRALVSLALVQGSLGDYDAARLNITRAVSLHSDDYRVHYYAAYLDALAGKLESAAASLDIALTLKPNFLAAHSLLASVRYRANRFDEAARIADQIIAANRNDVSAWYIKGMSFIRLGRFAEARQILSVALSIDSEDEFIRAALEDTVLKSTALESSERSVWASWHFNRARSFQSNNLLQEALFEYRRGLRIHPYAPERQEYAELLRIQGYPGRQLEELKFLQDIGRSNRVINDTVEAYNSLLYDTLPRIWQVNPYTLQNRHWKVAVFSVGSQSGMKHVDAGAVAAAYFQDLLSHDGNIAVMSLEIRQPSFSSAFRTAREAGADYFLILSVKEQDRDLSIQADMYVGRTGSSAASFSVYKVGQDRLRNGSRQIVSQLQAALPFRALILQRKANLVLIDKGKADGVAKSNTYQIIRKGSSVVRNEGVGLVYSPKDVIGTLVIDEVDELVSQGTATRAGFYDEITKGDEVIAIPEKGPSQSVPQDVSIDPELRYLLRTLR